MQNIGFVCSNSYVNKAFRIAMGDIVSNITLTGEHDISILMAGMDYDRPWTRDAALNTWNGLCLMYPDVTRDTLLYVLTLEKEQLVIGGQYWDAVIWTVGAWAQYLATGDKEFLQTALEATRNTLKQREDTEFDPDYNLFRGPAVYGDGISAYPDIYAQAGGSSSILEWPAYNPDHKVDTGYGIPMFALSTNSAYYQAYVLAHRMAEELGMEPDAEWQEKAYALWQAINTYFWNDRTGTYHYLVDSFGGSDAHEGMGHCLAILFDVANLDQREEIFKSQYIAPAGIPCVWPTFDRYAEGFGRHSGTVWPHIQALWADAAARFGKTSLFQHEFYRLTRHAVRDYQFAELYHPVSGEIYGGLQEASPDDGMLWPACKRQLWSASGYLRMILYGIAGIRMTTSGITFEPLLPEQLDAVTLRGIRYRNALLNIYIEGSGNRVVASTIDGKSVNQIQIPIDAVGEQDIRLIVSP